MLSECSNQRIYVETTVRGDMATLWARSQDPRQHRRWDLRFTTIEPAGASRFRYAVRVLPGIEIAGTGTPSGERSGGRAAAVLRFGSLFPLSLLGAGSRRRVPASAPSRTGHDYDVRWGIAGRAADRVFRPMAGWGTAWSFDRLRLWVERGITPGRRCATRWPMPGCGWRRSAWPPPAADGWRRSPRRYSHSPCRPRRARRRPGAACAGAPDMSLASADRPHRQSPTGRGMISP